MKSLAAAISFGFLFALPAASFAAEPTKVSELSHIHGKDVIDLAASPTDPNTLFAGTMTGLVESQDGAASCQQVGPANIPASLVEAAPDGSLYVFFAGTGLFKQSPDGSWGILTDNLADQVFLHLAADPADAAHLLAVTQESAVLESRDGGKTWAALTP